MQALTQALKEFDVLRDKHSEEVKRRRIGSHCWPNCCCIATIWKEDLTPNDMLIQDGALQSMNHSSAAEDADSQGVRTPLLLLANNTPRVTNSTVEKRSKLLTVTDSAPMRTWDLKGGVVSWFYYVLSVPYLVLESISFRSHSVLDIRFQGQWRKDIHGGELVLS